MDREVGRPARFVRLPEIISRVGISRPTIYRMIKAGKFPRPIKIGHISVWSDLDIDRWVEATIENRSI